MGVQNDLNYSKGIQKASKRHPKGIQKTSKKLIFIIGQVSLQNKFIVYIHKTCHFFNTFYSQNSKRRFEDEGQSRDDIRILFISSKINVYCLCKVFFKEIF